MKELYQQIFNTIEQEHEQYKNLTLNSRVLIVDGLNNFIRIWVENPTTNDDGQHVGGIVGFLFTLGVVIRATRPTRLFVVLDGKDSSSRRKKIFPQYKENRGAGTRLNRAYKWADEEEERKQMQYQMLRTIKYLKNLPVTFVMLDNIEADDSIAYLTEIFKQKEEMKELFISSTDKDFYQLLDDRVKIWHPIKKEVYGAQKVEELFGVQPHNFLLFKSIVGDKSDNIPGIKGLGPKTISKCFDILKEERKITPDDLLQHSENHRNDGRAYNLLADNRNQYLMNYKLMNLSSTNIPNSSRLKIVSLVNQKVNEINLVNIQELVKEDKLWGSFKNINDWVLSNFLTLNAFAKTS